jgi:hypothetical protein
MPIDPMVIALIVVGAITLWVAASLLYQFGARRGYTAAYEQFDTPRDASPTRRRTADPNTGWIAALVLLITLTAVVAQRYFDGPPLPEIVVSPTAAPAPAAAPAPRPQGVVSAPAAPAPAEPPAAELVPIVEQAPAPELVPLEQQAPPVLAQPAPVEQPADLIPIPTPYWGEANRTGGSFDTPTEPTPLPEGVYWGPSNRTGGSYEPTQAAISGGSWDD